MSKRVKLHPSCHRCRTVVTSSSPLPPRKSILTSPTVQGVWIFHRHGDRTPARSLVPPHHFEDEKHFWSTKIPSGMSLFDSLCQQFPVQIHESNNQGQFFDVHGNKEPYGFLTYRGIEQMKFLGKSMATRYYDESSASDSCRGTSTTTFLEQWEIQAYSTNYLRTVKSVQCFLHGLLSDNNNNNKDFHHIEGSQEGIGPTIQVRERSQDTLNAFDRQPQLMKKLVEDVVSKDSFVSYDEKFTPLAQRLTSILPGLAKAANYGGPSGINWILASDHFVCREAHDLNLSRFSMFHNDEQTDTLLSSLRTATLSHLAWRFRQWYQCPSLLAAIVLAPLREIEMQMKKSTSSKAKEDRKPFVIYSCHDVTLLSLLYGIGADFVASEEELKAAGVATRKENGEERWKYWPEYATSLIFELVRDGDEHFVRILLNGKPVRLISQLQRFGSLEKEDIHETTLDDFSKIINNVENKSHVHAKIEDDQIVRDMSTWTG
jgi:hypothetical protein